MQTRTRSLAVAALASVLFAAPALASKGPPWISIELPANPYDRSTRDAFLLVHSFHHGTAMGFIVTGTAEGMVNGERRSLKLDFAETSREGVYALKRSWPQEGTWTLVIKANQGPDDAATAGGGKRLGVSWNSAAGRKIFFVLESNAIVFALCCVFTAPASSKSSADFS